MDTKALRQKILDLAIRGKLVPQDPTDEPASVLLERIRVEKQQMVKDGKLKPKDIKNDTVIFKGDDNLHYEKFADGSVKCIEDEIPFELPEGWEWTRVRDIAMVKGGKRLPKGASFSEEITSHAYIRVTDMKNHSINITDLRYISDEIFSVIKNYTISKEDLYVTIAGTIGVVGEVPDQLDGMNLTENAVKITNIAINKTFLCIILQSDFVQQQFQDKTHQVAMPKLALERILSTLIPICPYAEQVQIVDKFQTCDDLIFTVDTEKEELQKIVALSKSKILDLAIRGKLVPQDPNDEPASVLLERIRVEKEELIKQGKIKRDKKESVIFKGDDNSYYVRQNSHVELMNEQFIFELPHNWEWCTLLNLAEIDLGKTLDGAKNTGINHPYLRSANVRWNNVDLSDLKEMLFEPDEIERYSIRFNDLLICEGGDVGRSCVWTNYYEIQYQNALHRVRFFDKCNPFFFMYYMMYYENKGILKSLCKGVTIKHLTGNVLSLIPFALPPIEEQTRIVQKLDRIFLLLDNMIND